MTDTRPVPQALGATLERSWGLLAETLNPEAMALLQQHLEAQGCRGDFDRLLATSEFFRGQFIRHAEWALEQVAAGQLFCPPEHDPVAWRQQLEALVPERADEAAVMSALRIFRNRRMLGIVARELTGRGTLADTFRQLTGLADTTIQFAVRWATDSLSERFGQPVGEWSGDVQELVVLGMGKLGGGELNQRCVQDQRFFRCAEQLRPQRPQFHAASPQPPGAAAGTTEHTTHQDPKGGCGACQGNPAVSAGIAGQGRIDQGHPVACSGKPPGGAGTDGTRTQNRNRRVQIDTAQLSACSGITRA